MKGYRIKQESGLNPLILASIKKAGSLIKLANQIGINKSMISQALHNKPIPFNSKLRIARFFNLETEFIACPFCNQNYYNKENGRTTETKQQ